MEEVVNAADYSAYFSQILVSFTDWEFIQGVFLDPLLATLLYYFVVGGVLFGICFFPLVFSLRFLSHFFKL